MLPLPAPQKVKCFRVCFFKVLLLPQKFNRFHIPAPFFKKNASASGSSNRLMLLSLLPAFFKVLLLLQKFNRFQFPLPYPWMKISYIEHYDSQLAPCNQHLNAAAIFRLCHWSLHSKHSQIHDVFNSIGCSFCSEDQKWL